jgi:hypothetical protein
MNSWSDRHLFAVWFLIGIATAAILQVGQANSFGGRPEGLLFVGDLQDVAPLVVAELPDAPVTPGHGHDGQIFYAVALDLRGEWVPETLESASYRYRRVLYPALASLFGILDGEALLWGMVTLAAVPVGVASGTAALLATRRGVTPWLALAVILNPGVWLSARLLTADNLALALGLVAVHAYLRNRDILCVVALAAAALTKEPAVVFAVGLAGYSLYHREYRRVLLLTTSLLPLLGWLLYVHTNIGSILDAGGNTALPGFGIYEARTAWSDQRLRDNVWVAITLAAMVAAVFTGLRSRSMWTWLAIGWVLVGLVASHLVWDIGNNVIRALSPLIPLTAFQVAEALVELRTNSPRFGLQRTRR